MILEGPESYKRRDFFPPDEPNIICARRILMNLHVSSGIDPCHLTHFTPSTLDLRVSSDKHKHRTYRSWMSCSTLIKTLVLVIEDRECTQIFSSGRNIITEQKQIPGRRLLLRVNSEPWLGVVSLCPLPPCSTCSSEKWLRCHPSPQLRSSKESCYEWPRFPTVEKLQQLVHMTMNRGIGSQSISLAPFQLDECQGKNPSIENPVKWALIAQTILAGVDACRGRESFEQLCLCGWQICFGQTKCQQSLLHSIPYLPAH
jgi:hypothetical protein